MKKKLIFPLCALFVVVAVGGMIIFVLTGKGDEAVRSFDPPGTWEVVAIVNDEVPTFVDNEFMVFDSETARAYKNSESTPYAESTYKLVTKEKLSIELPELSRSYIVDVKSDNYICLYENADNYMKLVRYPNVEREAITVEPSLVIGKWKVIYRNSKDVADEVLEFGISELADYRNGSTDPYITSPYTWISEFCFNADQLKKTIEVHPLSDDTIIFVEKDTADVWELKKVN